MRKRPSREPLRRGPQFDSLETRAMMTHVPAAAAFQAHALKVEQAAEVRAAVQESHQHLIAPNAASTGTTGTNSSGGGNNLGTGGNANQPVSNTYSKYDINSNYIGGSIGLQAFVDGLYIDLYHRMPSSDEESFWTGTLESGRFAPYTVVSYFLISPEGVANGTGGQALRPSHPPANIYTGYLGGPIGVTAFVDGLYHDVLHRAPDPAGEAYWVGQIENHDLLPANITFSFLASQTGVA